MLRVCNSLDDFNHFNVDSDSKLWCLFYNFEYNIGFKILSSYSKILLILFYKIIDVILFILNLNCYYKQLYSPLIVNKQIN